MSTHTYLDAAATERKARLAQLKNLKRKAPPSSDEPSQDTNTLIEEVSQDISATILSGRNYDLINKAPKLGFDSAPNANTETLEDRAQAIAKQTAEEAAKENAEDKGIDLFKLQPKKPNWDLKRDLNKKLEILNVRTENAIARLVKERIEGQKKAKMENVGNGNGDGEEVGLKGEELVEGIHQREREEAEDERRAEENDDL